LSYEIRAIHERMVKNIVDPDTLRMTRLMRIACWIPKATNHKQNM